MRRRNREQLCGHRPNFGVEGTISLCPFRSSPQSPLAFPCLECSPLYPACSLAGASSFKLLGALRPSTLWFPGAGSGSPRLPRAVFVKSENS